MELQINNGEREYIIKNSFGVEIGKIYFNPADPNFLARVDKFGEKFSLLGEKADEIENLFNQHDKKALDMMIELDTEMKAEVDKLFAAKVSEVVFGATNCIATIDGIPFIERFITAVLPELKSATQKEAKAQQARISKYTKRYTK